MKFSWLLCLTMFAVSCGRPDAQSALNDRNPSNRSPNSDQYDKRFPRSPHQQMTPGELCDRPDEVRYPERINYCERNVDTELKKFLFAKYDRDLGYHTQDMNRYDFKIDHLIPLCMGGSNHEENLWPQHKTIYELTDPIEPFLCQLMAQGKMKQLDAVKVILEVKQAPETTDSRMQALQRN